MGKRSDKVDTVKEERKNRFLQALASGLSVGGSAKHAGVVRQTVYDWRESDPAFAELWGRALLDGNDSIRDEMWRRGRQGIEKPVYYQGTRIDTIREYSDTLLIVLAKSRMPAEFRDNVAVQHSGGMALSMKPMTPEQVALEIEEAAAKEAESDPGGPA